RTHLAAFLLSPEHADTLAHIWRLARAIGRYDEADRTPRPEPPAAHVEPLEPPRRRAARSSDPMRVTIEPSRPRREATEELSVSDLMVDLDAVAGESGLDRMSRRAASPDRTMPLELEDLLEIRRQGSELDPD